MEKSETKQIGIIFLAMAIVSLLFYLVVADGNGSIDIFELTSLISFIINMIGGLILLFF